MMPDTIEKAVCETCGVGTRENTLYCYNCGSKLEVTAPLETNGSVATVDDSSKAALDDLADKLSRESDDELAKAASERKKARVTQRKRLEYKWEPRDDSPVLPLIFAGFVGFAVLIVVILLVVWK
jgi:hypothetical protein